MVKRVGLDYGRSSFAIDIGLKREEKQNFVVTIWNGKLIEAPVSTMHVLLSTL